MGRALRSEQFLSEEETGTGPVVDKSRSFGRLGACHELLATRLEV